MEVLNSDVEGVKRLLEILEMPEKEMLEYLDKETEDMDEELKAMIENEKLETSEKEMLEYLNKETEDMDEELNAIIENIINK